METGQDKTRQEKACGSDMKLLIICEPRRLYLCGETTRVLDRYLCITIILLFTLLHYFILLNSADIRCDVI